MQARGSFRYWWQVQGSNLGRLRGWCARFCGVSGPGFRHAGRRAGVQVERPAGRTTWRPVLLPAHTGSGPGNGYGVVGCGPVGSWCSWQTPAAFIPSGVPAAGGRGGHGAVRVRAAGSIRPGGRPPVAGASKTSDHALPASGRAHAALPVAAVRSRTWPSRIA